MGIGEIGLNADDLSASVEAATKVLAECLLILDHLILHTIRIMPSRRENGCTTGRRRALRAEGVITALTPFESTEDPASGRLLAALLRRTEPSPPVFRGSDVTAVGVVKGIVGPGARARRSACSSAATPAGLRAALLRMPKFLT
ncbi:hypothetical protein [Rathayibacter sp. VKM Ac-2805]|uniref:hypothetical protein n=1 Tax=Rathayibacter sp. VKM Ac-2805 TaxID=2609258 RepID=UPI0013201820|nr:hypothetical protein [Rathayibacter sp. VKM Ac-2805]QHC75149.1 hypothetical protein GSU40_16490 [Rathayibacter sp. VKM Ac-2805]